MGCILRPKIALHSRKRTRERIGTLGGNNICFRKSLSQTFNLIRSDFSSTSPRFPFFGCFVTTQPSIRNTPKWFEGKPGPGSARLEDTPPMDLELKGIRTTICFRKSLSQFDSQFECVLFCFIKPILGNRYGPGVIP